MSAYPEDEFLDIIAAKGGAIEALDYGLMWSQVIGGDLREDWKMLEDAWVDFRRLLDRFEDKYDIEPM
ncbi:hypothetical protein SEA_JONJAMES_156 [Gordonia Phage JonJames]|nr:hypothetical protein SEA_JONJAMES_156 [Gordonia Phage JonJames]